jgi:hypothetical protein
MAFQGEYFVERYGKEAAARTPPFRRMLEMGLPVGIGTDATRVASYNPWTCLSWLVTGKTVGGTALYPASNLLGREEGLRQFTVGSAWFSREEDKKGQIAPGQYADLAVLSADYFAVPAESIRGIESVLTLVGGKVVFAASPFESHAPPPLPVLPEWSPVARYGGHWRPRAESRPGGGGGGAVALAHGRHDPFGCHGPPSSRGFGAPGCSCWAF